MAEELLALIVIDQSSIGPINTLDLSVLAERSCWLQVGRPNGDNDGASCCSSCYLRDRDSTRLSRPASTQHARAQNNASVVLRISQLASSRQPVMLALLCALQSTLAWSTGCCCSTQACASHCSSVCLSLSLSLSLCSDTQQSESPPALQCSRLAHRARLRPASVCLCVRQAVCVSPAARASVRSGLAHIRARTLGPTQRFNAL